MQKLLQDFVSEAKGQIQKEHPLAAQSVPLLSSLAEAMGYQAWRATRAYDHVEIMFGIRMRDGSAGYSIDFHDNPVGAPGRITSLHLSSGEMKELFAKMRMALLGEDKSGY